MPKISHASPPSGAAAKALASAAGIAPSRAAAAVKKARKSEPKKRVNGLSANPLISSEAIEVGAAAAAKKRAKVARKSKPPGAGPAAAPAPAIAKRGGRRRFRQHTYDKRAIKHEQGLKSTRFSFPKAAFWRVARETSHDVIEQLGLDELAIAEQSGVDVRAPGNDDDDGGSDDGAAAAATTKGSELGVPTHKRWERGAVDKLQSAAEAEVYERLYAANLLANYCGRKEVFADDLRMIEFLKNPFVNKPPFALAFADPNAIARSKK